VFIVIFIVSGVIEIVFISWVLFVFGLSCLVLVGLLVGLFCLVFDDFFVIVNVIVVIGGMVVAVIGGGIGLGFRFTIVAWSSNVFDVVIVSVVVGVYLVVVLSAL
jgi:hypothetical protein